MRHFDDFDDLDDVEDRLFAAEYFPPGQEPLPTTWQTKDGSVINIKDMRPTHLQNAYMMLCRAGQSNSPHAEAMKKELERRGDLNEMHPDDLA